MSISIKRLTNSEILQHIDDLANLRIEIFKEFPYIYQGSKEYEVQYLKKYIKSEKAALIAAFDQKTIIGIASCLPLADEENYVQKPFVENAFDLSRIFYFGESVLQKKYRGQGIGKAFFSEREKWARSFPDQYSITSFCAVERHSQHPLKPADYKPLDEFWKTQGYLQNPSLMAEFSWLDTGEVVETKKRMVFWLKYWGI